MSEVFSLATDRDEAITRTVGALRAGELVVLPTDTVYGLAVDAFNKDATAMVFKTKMRPRELPLPVLVSRPRQAWGLCAHIPVAATALAAGFWPGALTMILPEMHEMSWDLGDSRGGVAVRMPAHDDLLSILEQTGPLAVTSANITGEPTPRSIEEVREKLGDAVAVYIDGGPSQHDFGSTIVDVTSTQTRMVREGSITLGDVERVIGTTVLRA